MNRRSFFASLATALGGLWAYPAVAKLLRIPDRRVNLRARKLQDAMVKAYAEVTAQIASDCYRHGQGSPFDCSALKDLYLRCPGPTEFGGGTYLQTPLTYQPAPEPQMWHGKPPYVIFDVKQPWPWEEESDG